ncbi:MAG: YlxR family protein [Kouleothrix sp.]|nr:YlxR family protein [Kouleothrix sp.]
MAQAGKKSAGPRPKHVPVRMCIACRRSDAKRGLFRLVRDAEGRVSVDPTGKRAGRGAYLCHDPACWDQALKRRGLERALRVESLDPEDRAALEEIARGLVNE